MTIVEAAKEALAVQDACNLSGVVGAFHRITPVIWNEARKLGKGTDWVNTHPIVIMFLDKLNDLARYKEWQGSESILMRFSHAYDQTARLARGEIVVHE